MSSEAPYQYVNPAAFMHRYQEAQSRPSQSGDRGYKPQQGPPGKPIRNVIRMMPPHPRMVVTLPDGTQGHDPIIGSVVHFSLGPQQNVAVPCLETFSKPCPACDWCGELRSRARREGDPEKSKQVRDLAWKMRGTLRFAANIVDMSKPERGVQVFWFSDDQERKLRGCFLDDDVPPQFRDITHPSAGRNIIIEVSTKPNTTYAQWDTVRAADTATQLPDPEWLQQVQDLTEHLYEPTAEEVVAALQKGQRIDRGRPGLVRAPAAAPVPTAGFVPSPTAIRTTAVLLPPPPPPPLPLPSSTKSPVPHRGRPPRVAALPPPVSAPVTAPPAPLPPPAVPGPAVPPAAPSVQMPLPHSSVSAPRAALNGEHPAWTESRRLLVAEGAAFSQPWVPKEITTEELVAAHSSQRIVSCFTHETLPSDAVCQRCSLVIPCYAVVRGLLQPNELPIPRPPATPPE